jgi:hypothetical protein
MALPTKSAQALSFLTCLQKVTGSNVGPGAGYTDWDSSVILLSSYTQKPG